MAVSYAWEVIQMKKVTTDDKSDVVIGVRWTCTGTDENGTTGVFFGATPFNPSKIDQSQFVSYETLTEETVLGWVKSIVVDHYWRHVKEQIEKQIRDKNSPHEEVTEFPWS